MRDYRPDFFDFSPTVYLNCAYQGPFPRATAARIEQAVQLKCHPDRLHPQEYFDLPDRVRARFAKLVGADPQEIAITNSATQGIGIVATGLDLKAGDEIIISSRNFPANIFTWLHLRRRGVRVRVIRPAGDHVTPAEVEAELSPHTRVVALDWVSYTSGARLNLTALADLAHGRGALLVVDGTQGVGAVPLDLREAPVDALAVAAYKWLLGPYGTGFLYVRPEVQERLDLAVVNWMTVEGSDDFDALPIEEFTLPRAARIFDVPETPNFINLNGLEASLEFVEQAGVAAVFSHCTRLLDRLAAGLRDRGLQLSDAAQPEHRSTILAFKAESLAATGAVHRALAAEHVAVSLRHGFIRVSPHLYNTEEDIERLLSVVRRA
jgi:selenocysteine lyase/cysteine desulfurase